MNPELKEKSRGLLFALRLEVVMWEEEVGVVALVGGLGQNGAIQQLARPVAGRLQGPFELISLCHKVILYACLSAPHSGPWRCPR